MNARRLAATAALCISAALAAGCGPKAYSLRLSSPPPFEENGYKDDLIYARFSIEKGALRAHIYNRAKHPVRIDWSRAQIVDPQGKAHAVHLGAPSRPQDLDAPAKLTVLEADRSIETVIHPKDRYTTGGKGGGGYAAEEAFQRLPLIEGDPTGQVKLLFPFDGGGKSHFYTFVFDVQTSSD
jgi:hypothetical protein